MLNPLFRLTGMRTLIDVDHHIHTLAARVGAPDPVLPHLGAPRGTAGAYIEVHSGQYHYVLVEHGRQSVRNASTRFDDLVYWVFDHITHRLASEYGRRHRVEGQDPRRTVFPRQIELMGRISPQMADRVARKIHAILQHAPYDDELAGATVS